MYNINVMAQDCDKVCSWEETHMLHFELLLCMRTFSRWILMSDLDCCCRTLCSTVGKGGITKGPFPAAGTSCGYQELFEILS